MAWSAKTVSWSQSSNLITLIAVSPEGTCRLVWMSLMMRFPLWSIGCYLCFHALSFLDLRITWLASGLLAAVCRARLDTVGRYGVSWLVTDATCLVASLVVSPLGADRAALAQFGGLVFFAERRPEVGRHR